ncbi:response regulator [Sanguibacter antarcticus]|uniref:Response regulator receiver domain-containing protein n=1 Tax=Sanguibacter antarcticus TaxID=372484 RepID=A0A2A9E8J0_9MICO|nr:response regulator [Sanguibacter antarcticus]PFG35153.1 response regulator receiver domain-containing protein [Sanguibacter antarcticus]
MNQHTNTPPADHAGVYHLVAPIAVVVEDDADIRALIETILVRAGMQVHTASTAAEGIALTSRIIPDVVTIDIGLPDADGLDVAAFLRDLTPTRDIPILMISANANAIDMERARSRGAEAYLSKPFRPRELRDRVLSLLAVAAAPLPKKFSAAQCPSECVTGAAAS